MKRWTIVLLWVAWIPHEKDLPCCILHGLYENSCQGTVGHHSSFFWTRSGPLFLDLLKQKLYCSCERHQYNETSKVMGILQDAFEGEETEQSKRNRDFKAAYASTIISSASCSPCLNLPQCLSARTSAVITLWVSDHHTVVMKSSGELLSLLIDYSISWQLQWSSTRNDIPWIHKHQIHSSPSKSSFHSTSTFLPGRIQCLHRNLLWVPIWQARPHLHCNLLFNCICCLTSSMLARNNAHRSTVMPHTSFNITYEGSSTSSVTRWALQHTT
jgi:hypothetical protein